MRDALVRWWQVNRALVGGTAAVAIVLGVIFGLTSGPRAGVLVCGSVLAIMAVLMLSSATMLGANETLDRQIAMREREDARRRAQ